MLDSMLAKVSAFFGVYDEIEEGTENYDAPRDEAAYQRSEVNKPKKSKITPLHTNVSMPTIEIMNPEVFDDIADIVKHAQERKIIILKINALSKEDSRRVVDYASGIAVALNGEIRKLSGDLFMLIPYGIEILGDYKHEFDNDNILKWSF